MRLDRCDLEAVSEGVRELYAVTDLGQVPGTMIGLLARLVHADSISYNEFEAATGRLVSVIQPKLLHFDEMLPLFTSYFGEHPVVNHYHETGSLLPFKISDFVSNRDYRRTGLYHEFYRSFDVEHQMGFFLCGGPQHEVCMAINRKRKDFSERDRQVITLLRPHLTQALANAGAVTALSERAGYLEQATESSEQGVAWLDRNGKILFVTDRAQRWFADYFAPHGFGADLPERLKGWIALQLGSPDRVREPLVLNKGDGRLRIRLVERGDRLLLLLTETCQSVTVDRFAAHGLTPREGEVLSWMAEGKSNSEIATILGASSRTIDKHVERVLAKLSVETRKGAMLWALEVQRR